MPPLRRYGAKPGAAAYVQCRTQLDVVRTGAEAAVDAAKGTSVATRRARRRVLRQ
jgi:hypothetical protein